MTRLRMRQFALVLWLAEQVLKFGVWCCEISKAMGNWVMRKLKEES